MYVLVDGNYSDHVEIWKSENGNSWEQAGEDGLGYNNCNSYNFIVFDDYMYVTLRIDNATATPRFVSKVVRSRDGVSWEQVGEDSFGDTNNGVINEMVVYNGNLYVTTNKWDGNNYLSGTEIWRTSHGTTWEQIGGDGLGSYDIGYITSMYVFNNNLFLGGTTFDGSNSYSKVLKSVNGKTWEQVNKNNFNLYIPRELAPRYP